MLSQTHYIRLYHFLKIKCFEDNNNDFMNESRSVRRTSTCDTLYTVSLFVYA